MSAACRQSYDPLDLSETDDISMVDLHAKLGLEGSPLHLGLKDINVCVILKCMLNGVHCISNALCIRGTD